MFYDHVIFHSLSQQYLVCNDVDIVHFFDPKEQKVTETVLNRYSSILNLPILDVGELYFVFTTKGIRFCVSDLQGDGKNYFIKYDENE